MKTPFKAPLQAKANPGRGALSRELMQGSSCSVDVPRYVRALANVERNGGGTFQNALEARSACESWGSLGREVFGDIYGMGVNLIAEDDAQVGSKWIRSLFGEVEAMPEWSALKGMANGDAWATGMASATVMNVLQFETPAPEQKAESLQDQVEFLEGLMKDAGATSPAHLRRLAATKGALKKAIEQDEQAVAAIEAGGSAIRRALAEPLQKVMATIKESQDAMAGLMGGHGVGSLRVTGTPDAIRTALRRNAKLARVAKLAGRLRATASQKQRTKTQYAREEIADVTCGDDVSRMVASELMLLGDEDTEMLLYRKMLEHSAIQYELRGKERLAQGPIVFVLDESGSMQGSRDEWAKACAIAIMEIASRQKRPFALVHFDSSVKRRDVFADPSAGISIEKLAEMVGFFSGGGTNIAAGLSAASDLIKTLPEGKTLRKADIVLISDGCDGSQDDTVKELERCTENGVAVHGIAIGCPMPQWMTKRLSSCTEMTDNDVNANTDKVHSVFSI